VCCVLCAVCCVCRVHTGGLHERRYWGDVGRARYKYKILLSDDSTHNTIIESYSDGMHIAALLIRWNFLRRVCRIEDVFSSRGGMVMACCAEIVASSQTVDRCLKADFFSDFSQVVIWSRFSGSDLLVYPDRSNLDNPMPAVEVNSAGRPTPHYLSDEMRCGSRSDGATIGEAKDQEQKTRRRRQLAS
jgi:hypothetical protein